MEKLEGYWMEAQSLCKVRGSELCLHSALEQTEGSVTPWLCRQAVDEHLKETQAQYQTLERKYSKAKRLVKEYQQK